MIPIIVLDPKCWPTRKTSGAAGFDVVARTGALLMPMQPQLIPCGFKIGLPLGMEAQIRGRSGHASQGVWTHVGTVDADYRGEVCVLLLNLNPGAFTVRPGDRIAQMVIGAVADDGLVQVEELTATARGDGGFGSTGGR
jgi:dUTP pyrophosphatase